MYSTKRLVLNYLKRIILNPYYCIICLIIYITKSEKAYKIKEHLTEACNTIYPTFLPNEFSEADHYGSKVLNFYVFALFFDIIFFILSFEMFILQQLGYEYDEDFIHKLVHPLLVMPDGIVDKYK